MKKNFDMQRIKFKQADWFDEYIGRDSDFPIPSPQLPTEPTKQAPIEVIPDDTKDLPELLDNLPIDGIADITDVSVTKAEVNELVEKQTKQSKMIKYSIIGGLILLIVLFSYFQYQKSKK